MPDDVAPDAPAPPRTRAVAPPAGPLAAATPAEAQAGLQVRGVSVRFGGLTALDDVHLGVAPGEVVGVIGPNGAGKTTLFNVVCGFVRPNAGELVWRGEPLRRLRPHRLASLGIARTLQGLGLFPQLTALENVMVGASRHARAGFASALLGLPRSDRDEKALRASALAALSDLGAGSVAHRLPGTLPYPVQKRVALARALVSQPTLLLLDEPASGLSGDEMAELGALIRRLRGRMSVMLVEHHMDLVMSVCDRVVVLDFGQVIAAGTPEEVRADPRVLEAYLGDEAEQADAQGDGPVEESEPSGAGHPSRTGSRSQSQSQSQSQPSSGARRA